jgi:hypothetical protein
MMQKDFCNNIGQLRHFALQRNSELFRPSSQWLVLRHRSSIPRVCVAGRPEKREYIHGRSAVIRGIAVEWNKGAV